MSFGSEIVQELRELRDAMANGERLEAWYKCSTLMRCDGETFLQNVGFNTKDAHEAANRFASKIDGTCPICDSPLEPRSCKLVCSNPTCPYLMDCSD